MKITREEFNQLIDLYRDFYDFKERTRDILSEDTLDKMENPFYWIECKLGLEYVCDLSNTGSFSVLYDVMKGRKVPIKWKIEQTEDGYEARDIEYSNNMDEIYDNLVNGEWNKV